MKCCTCGAEITGVPSYLEEIGIRMECQRCTMKIKKFMLLTQEEWRRAMENLYQEKENARKSFKFGAKNNSKITQEIRNGK